MAAFIRTEEDTDNDGPIFVPVTLLVFEGYTDFLAEAKFGVR